MNLHSKILCADAITVNIMSDSITFVQKKSKPREVFYSAHQCCAGAPLSTSKILDTYTECLIVLSY